MALSDHSLTTGATAIEAEITHMQLHSGARGASGTTNVVSGSRIAVSGSVDSDGDISWADLAWTGLTADQAVAEVSYWDASSAGNYCGGTVLTGDSAANAAGDFNITSLVETGTAS